jgi:hypothetical protein
MYRARHPGGAAFVVAPSLLRQPIAASPSVSGIPSNATPAQHSAEDATARQQLISGREFSSEIWWLCRSIRPTTGENLVTGYWLVTAAHTVLQDVLITVVVLAYAAIARDIVQEMRGQ